MPLNPLCLSPESFESSFQKAGLLAHPKVDDLPIPVGRNSGISEFNFHDPTNQNRLTVAGTASD